VNIKSSSQKCSEYSIGFKSGESTLAEIFIEDDQIKVVLEIGERDFEAFKDLFPLKKDNGEETKGLSLIERQKRFLKSGFVITADGKPLEGEVTLIEVRKRTERPSGYKNPPGGQKPSEYVIYVEIDYPLKSKPEKVIFKPPMNDAGYVSATIGFIVYHKSIPVIDFRFLGTNETLILDWKDPWYSKFDNPNLKRHHKSSLMSFLYIEPFEVRHEILLRLKDMEYWMDLGLKDDAILDPEKQKIVKEKLAEFFKKHNIVSIDGKPAKPIIDRVQFVKPNLMGIQVIEEPQDIEYLSAIVGIIIAYTVPEIPQEVTVDWDMFNEKIQRIPTNTTDPAGPFPYYLSPDDNILTWKNFLKNYKMPEVTEVVVSDPFMNIKIPMGSMVMLAAIFVIAWQVKIRNGKKRPIKLLVILGVVALAGSILLYPYFKISTAKPISKIISMSEEDSNFILNSLLKNVYRAFDFKDEEDIYDKLAISLDGDLLSDIYLQTRKGMEIENQGGARARVKDVEIKEIKGDPLPDELGFSFHSVWNVNGSVEHWGHKHNRINQYEAILTVKPVDGVWKITDLDLLEEKRVQPI